jgi:hypothetical protein
MLTSCWHPKKENEMSKIVISDEDVEKVLNGEITSKIMLTSNGLYEGCKLQFYKNGDGYKQVQIGIAECHSVFPIRINNGNIETMININGWNYNSHYESDVCKSVGSPNMATLARKFANKITYAWRVRWYPLQIIK